MAHNCPRAVKIASAATPSKGTQVHNAIEEMVMIPYAAHELVRVPAIITTGGSPRPTLVVRNTDLDTLKLHPYASS